MVRLRLGLVVFVFLYFLLAFLIAVVLFNGYAALGTA